MSQEVITDPYSRRVRELFAATAHAGELDGPAVSVADQGVRLRLSASLAGSRLKALRFKAWGCPHLIAAAEAFCAEFEDREAGDLGGFSAARLMQTLAVPAEKTGRILVLEDAVRSLGAKCCDNSDSTH